MGNSCCFPSKKKQDDADHYSAAESKTEKRRVHDVQEKAKQNPPQDVPTVINVVQNTIAPSEPVLPEVDSKQIASESKEEKTVVDEEASSDFKAKKMNDYFCNRLAKYYCNRNTANLSSEFPLRDDIASFFKDIYQDAFYDSFRAIRPSFDSDFSAYMPLAWIVDLSFKLVNHFFSQLCDSVITFPTITDLGRNIAREALQASFSMEEFSKNVFDHESVTRIVAGIAEQSYSSDIIAQLQEYTEQVVKLAWLFTVQDSRFQVSFREGDLEFDEKWDDRHPKSEVGPCISSVLWPATVFNGRLHSKFKRIVFTTTHERSESVSLFWQKLPSIQLSNYRFQVESEALKGLVEKELRKRIQAWFPPKAVFEKPQEINAWLRVLNEHLRKNPSSELHILSMVGDEVIPSFIDEFVAVHESAGSI
eukprot:TRINITY_DN3798_c0_g1_i2.p1 TRINITY_DN3798_c0_g1~~TRINITY_DN3798_c0_g1_i2.p1  ORF type:complete len:420 (-),score=101.57 TRINITY_DN3798_c0_g1_i2:121-1380(-)